MQIATYSVNKMQKYKSSKARGWVGKVGGGGHFWT